MAEPLTPALDAEQFAFSLNGGVTLRGYRGEVSEGVPLVLLHSINAAPSAMEMRPLFEHYRDKRPVWVPDLPGFGLSDRPDVTYSSGLYARWLAEWLDSLGHQGNAVHGAGSNAQLAAGALGLDHRVHKALCAHDGVNRTRVETKRAADTGRFINDRQ